MTEAISSGVRIAGICAAVPSNVIDNRIFGLELFGEELEGVIRATGVEKRRVCPRDSGVTALDLAVFAARKLQSEGSYQPDEIGGVVFVTQTPDYPLPNNSTQAQHQLGLSKQVAALDVDLACSGYVYGLWIGSMMVQSLNKPVLLLDAETHSYFVSPKDKTTALLFGDAGTATLLVPDPEGTPWHFEFETDGSLGEALCVPEGGSRGMINEQSALYREYPDGGIRRPIDMRMDGMAVFNFVVTRAPSCLNTLMSRINKTAADFDVLALHQANLYMIRQVAKKIGFNPKTLPISLDKYGNSSSPTIPVTLASELHQQIESQKLKVLAAGFGGGLSLGAVSFSIGPCICPGVIEYPIAEASK